jgi:cytochrome c peroxidase
MKMNKLQAVSISFLSLVLVFAACTKDAPTKGLAIPQLPNTPYDYVDDLPPHLDNIFWADPSNIDQRATLGRVLFHDTRLSVSNNISCGSCHLPSKGYADGKQFSEGWRGELTTRNAQSLVNPGMQSIFFWDARSFDLNEQVFMPIQNHIEMGINNMDDIVAKVNALDYYPSLFEEAFDSPEADLEKIQIALSTYVRSMVSYRSKWDEGFAQNFQNFTPLELEGKELFESNYKCNNCHNGSNFNGWGGDIANIGLEHSDDIQDIGVGATWGESLNGSFKVPSLRNTMVSAPYMHDGRFATIDDVIDHYDHGVIDSPKLDYRLRDLEFGFFDDIFFFEDFADVGPRRLNTTPHERDALKAFLHTLTDEAYLNDVRYSNPFVMP